MDTWCVNILICKSVLHCTWCKVMVIKPKIFSDIIISHMPCLALQAQSSVKLCHRSITSLGWLRFLSGWQFIGLLFNQCLLPREELLELLILSSLLTLCSLSRCLSLCASTGHLAVPGDIATSVSELFRCFCDVLLLYFALSVNPHAKTPEHPVSF